MGTTKTANKLTPNEKYSPEKKKKIQTLLKEEGFFKGDITGNYLSQTTEAARKMQQKLKDLGYTIPLVDGDFGDKSMAAYNEYVKNGKKAKTAVANGNTAKGETDAKAGKVEVGKVNTSGKTGTGTETKLTNGSGITYRPSY